MVNKADVVELLKTGMLNEDSHVFDPDECNAILEWAIDEVKKMKPVVQTLVPLNWEGVSRDG